MLLHRVAVVIVVIPAGCATVLLYSGLCLCQVEILVGKDKGKQGLVNCIIKERNWVYVEGLNCVRSRFQRISTYFSIMHWFNLCIRE